MKITRRQCIINRKYIALAMNYDFNGNMVEYDKGGQTTEYTYDRENRLTSIHYPNGSEDTFKFAYNGNLMQKVSGGVTIRYVYSGGPAPIAELNVNTGEWTNFIVANGETWAMKKSSGTQYLHKDQLGSVIAISDQTGTVTDTFQYDPWGKTLNHTGTTQTDYGFVGGHGVRTLSNGQMVMGRRLYDPNIGRFTTKDPIGFASGDLNNYLYGQNNPLVNIDPLGLDWFRNDNEEYTVGRTGTIVSPGPSGLGKYIDDYIPAGHTFGNMHDQLVGDLTDLGVPDILANIPTMPLAYDAAVITEVSNSITSGVDEVVDAVEYIYDAVF